MYLIFSPLFYSLVISRILMAQRGHFINKDRKIKIKLQEKDEFQSLTKEFFLESDRIKH